jgi:GNAT superfamily N-acetyltransferase
MDVAQSGGRLLGYGLAQDFGLAQDIGPGLRTTLTTGRVHDLYVDPEARRLGAGKAIMVFILAWSIARPQPMILDWQASPSAVGFYEALGSGPIVWGTFRIIRVSLLNCADRRGR